LENDSPVRVPGKAGHGGSADGPNQTDLLCMIIHKFGDHVSGRSQSRCRESFIGSTQ
jgi:hypothetical protein